jgi:monoterpene epsilon-lactone hydrolase
MSLVTNSAACEKPATSDAALRAQHNPPVPQTVSTAARAELARARDAAPASLEERREACARIQDELGSRQRDRYTVQIEERQIGGVPVHVFTPPHSSAEDGQPILVNFHGGGFVLDSGSMTENIPIAALSGLTVIAALYRCAPEFPFPAAVDDAEAVYRALLEKNPGRAIGLYGTSAGALLCAQLIVRLQSKGLRGPGVLGFFSGSADMSRAGDSEYFFAPIEDPRPVAELLAPYINGHDATDPAMSPLYSDLAEFPPTLCFAGTRDFMLSQTIIFHRALLRAGVDARLTVFEAMPHVHWCYLEAPESDEAFELAATFFREHLCDAHSARRALIVENDRRNLTSDGR